MCDRLREATGGESERLAMRDRHCTGQPADSGNERQALHRAASRLSLYEHLQILYQTDGRDLTGLRPQESVLLRLRQTRPNSRQIDASSKRGVDAATVCRIS